MAEAKEYSQEGRLFWVKFDGLDDTFLLGRFQGKEGISQPFHFTLDFATNKPEAKVSAPEARWGLQMGRWRTSWPSGDSPVDIFYSTRP